MASSPDDESKYGVGTLTCGMGSHPDTVKVRLYDPNLLPTLERYLEKNGLVTLSAIRQESGFVEYTLDRPHDAGEIATLIKQILWYAAYGKSEGNYHQNGDALTSGE